MAVRPTNRWTRRFRTRIEWALAAFLVARLRRSSLAGSARWSRAIARLAWLALSRPRSVAVANVRRACPDLPGDEAVRLARMSFRHFAICLRDAVRMPEDEPCVRWRVPDALDSIVTEKRPAIVLTGHLGSWEVAAEAIARRGRPLHLVVATPKNALVAAMVDEIRRRWGVIPHAREQSLRPIVEALRRGELVGTAVDQWARAGAVWVPFFGENTPFARGLFDLALRENVPVVAIWAARRGAGSADAEYDLTTETVWDGSRPGLKSEDIVARWVAMLEGMIRSYPEQYLWMHDRWKHSRTAN